MYLTATNLIPFLLDHAFVAPERVLSGGVRVFEAGRRNRNFHVLIEDTEPLFVKQAGGPDVAAVRTLDQEARLYRVIASTATTSRLGTFREWLPRFIGADGPRRALVTQGVEHGTSLMNWHLQTQSYPPELATHIGRALAQIHPKTNDLIEADFPSECLPGQLPWVLQLPPDPTTAPTSPPDASAQLLLSIQQTPGFAAALHALTQHWHQRDLIHGDMKWDNILRVEEPPSDPSKASSPSIKLVDWELLDRGDGLWDVGALFQAHWFQWIVSIPFHPGVDPHDAARHAQTPIAQLHPSMQALWQTYIAERHSDKTASETHDDLLLAIRYGAARLVQTAFESVPNVAAPTPQAHMMLRVAHHILLDPASAARELLGLPTPSAS